MTLLDTFSACLAFGPLGIYLLVVGLINLGRRPVVVTGTRETLALGLAVAGLVIVGPMQLFMPQDAAARFGWAVWVLLVLFYALCLTLAVMLSRSRLIVYNISLDALRPKLFEAAQRLDHDATASGAALSMPQMRVQLQLEHYPPMHNTSLVATPGAQSASGWRQVEIALRRALQDVPATPRTRGLLLLLIGTAILTALWLVISENPQAIARGINRLLHP
jgi:hypothetical protein